MSRPKCSLIPASSSRTPSESPPSSKKSSSSPTRSNPRMSPKRSASLATVPVGVRYGRCAGGGGAGSAARSSLSRTFRGSMSSATKALGTIVVGTRVARSRRSFQALRGTDPSGATYPTRRVPPSSWRIGTTAASATPSSDISATLDLAGRDHRAAHLHARVEPSEMLEQPVVAPPTLVRGTEAPATVGFPEEMRSGQLGIPPVATGLVTAPDDDDAARFAMGDRRVVLVDDPYLGLATGPAHGHRAVAELVVRREVPAGDASGLGRSEADRHDRVGSEQRTARTNVHGVDGLAAHGDLTHAGHRAGRCGLHQRPQHTRHQREVRDPRIPDPVRKSRAPACADRRCMSGGRSSIR